MDGELDATAPYLAGRSLSDWRGEFDRNGYVVFERVLAPETLAAIRAALEPWLDGGKTGRNDFEGFATNRVYALLGKSPVFAELATHPLPLAFAEAELGADCLLSACLAINLHPGETVQPWHFDDAGIHVPRPRRAYGLSAFWSIDETTDENGATEIIPGSHLWGAGPIPGASQFTDFFTGSAGAAKLDADARSDAVKLVMPPGSLALAKGTLWHRGGANRSDKPRLIITPQYCPGWARPLETMLLAVPPPIAATLPRRARELLGYSIHPPFMGYVDGMHPARTLPGGQQP
jgi:ectoine hydroxylase-related dioxygenase (phytanoyl-CoA dioxygenase family)